MNRRRYLGSWALPSGNSCNLYLMVADGRLECAWDRPPSPSWPAGDVEQYRRVTFPEILRAVASATGKRTLGVVA